MYPYRHYIFIAAEEQEAANALAAVIDPDDGSNTFTVPLSASGENPPTHFACSTLSDDTMAGAMYDSEESLTTVVWWRVDSSSLELIDTNHAAGVVGEAWTFADALISLGLARIEEVT